ncbi:MAG: hypothetical protein HYX53_02935 [Chloroflexi bacterium]|nr:hypothetical protein [Chloroflexota bacterium]
MVVKDRMWASEVRGLTELQRELRTANPELARRLQQVNKRLVESVADEARSAAGSSVSTRSKASIRPNASGREARVVAGGQRAPEFYGQEFGGGARPRTRQFPPHRGREGYFLWPTVRRRLGTAFEEWNAIFDEIFNV